MSCNQTLEVLWDSFLSLLALIDFDRRAKCLSSSTFSSFLLSISITVSFWLREPSAVYVIWMSWLFQKLFLFTLPHPAFLFCILFFSCSVVLYRSSIILPSLHSLHLCRCVTLISGLRTRTEAAAQWQSDMGEQHKHPSKLFSFFLPFLFLCKRGIREAPAHRHSHESVWLRLWREHAKGGCRGP